MGFFGKLFGKKNNEEEQLKASVANFAFDNLLQRDKDYTVAAEVNGAILVQKEVKWAYCHQDRSGVQALFTIKTDKGIFAFQANGESVSLIPAELAMSMYEFK